ncbi:MAG TPA: DUF72 domain-containing protein, partial [Acidobacteria bacterium]|nr:DUF72 domain-containing protein [Acidobacteriota bacterium]
EINYTFYRMPTDRLLAGWSSVTPDHFRFTLKAPRRITHIARLRGCEEMVSAFCGAAQTLGRNWACCCFSCRRPSRSIWPCSTSFSASCHRGCGRLSSFGMCRGTTRMSSIACGRADWRSASPTASA